jgi:hypothetical protein
MIRRVIHVGDGRHVEITEGELRLPPSPPDTTYLPDDRDYVHKKHVDLPGYAGWYRRRKRQLFQFTKNGRPPKYPHVHPDDLRYLKARGKFHADLDLQNIRKIMDLDSIAEEAMRATLEILRGPAPVGDKLKAARTLLDFSKIKPVAKSEVTVNSAEAWLDSLSDNEN